MKRQPLLAVVIACAWVAVARADVVHMKDGRKLKGKVTEQGGKVRIKMKFGTATVDRADVVRIDKDADPAGDYRAKAAKLAKDDADAHCRLGLWCKAQMLPAQAKREFMAAIAAEPDHAEARAELGYAHVRGRWVKEDTLLRSAVALQKIGNLDRCIAMLKPLASSRDEKGVKKQGALLLASVYEQKGDWSGAIAQYQSLTAMPLSDQEQTLVKARRDIIAAHPDGLYMVTEESRKSNDAPKGMQPLTNPAVMQTALRDKAVEFLDKGKGIYERARRVDVADPNAALKIFLEADTYFDQANALSKDIARSYKIEVVRKRMAVHAREHDRYMAKLQGVSQPTVYYYGRSGKFTRKTRVKWQAYIRVCTNLIKKADEHLQQMLELAQPYPDELSQFIALARKRADEHEKARAFLREQRKRDNIKR